MHAIVHNGLIVFGPTTWDASAFSKKLTSLVGGSYSLPVDVSNDFVAQFGDAQIVRVETSGAPTYDPDYQILTTTYTIQGDMVVASYQVTPIPITQCRDFKKQQVAALRYEKEVSGFDSPFGRISTDAISQSKLTGAVSLITLNPSAIIDWKGASGWVQLDADQIRALATAVGGFVQACFTREKALGDAIDTLNTFEEIRDLDITGGWPV